MVTKKDFFYKCDLMPSLPVQPPRSVMRKKKRGTAKIP